MFASVKPNKIWFLLEYPYPWGRKAFEESSLESPVKDHLAKLLDETPQSKLLFIKNQDSLFSDRITFFVGVGSEEQPRLHRFVLHDFDDLLDIDIRALLAGDQFPNVPIYSSPLYLVCTNGKRDQCCAKFGLEVYNEMVAYQGERVWQTTHVGGHRFAANVVSFPHAIYFGRLRAGEAKALMDANEAGEMLVDKYRGRACYPPEVQAAEYFLREQTGEVRIGAYRHTRTEEMASDQWWVEFDGAGQREGYRLVIGSEPLDAAVYTSCAEEESVGVDQYRLLDIESR